MMYTMMTSSFPTFRLKMPVPLFPQQSPVTNFIGRFVGTRFLPRKPPAVCAVCGLEDSSPVFLSPLEEASSSSVLHPGGHNHLGFS